MPDKQEENEDIYTWNKLLTWQYTGDLTDYDNVSFVFDGTDIGKGDMAIKRLSETLQSLPSNGCIRIHRDLNEVFSGLPHYYFEPYGALPSSYRLYDTIDDKEIDIQVISSKNSDEPN